MGQVPPATPRHRGEEEERAHAAREIIAMEYEDFRARFLRTVKGEREDWTSKVEESQAQLQQQATHLEKMYMDQLQQEKGQMEKKMDDLQAKFREECKQMAEEKAALKVQTDLARSECERLAAEKMQMFNSMTEFRNLCDKMMADGKKEIAQKKEAMAQELEKSREEMNQKMAEEKAAAERASAEMARKMDEYAERLASSREAMLKQMAEDRAAAERTSAEMARKIEVEKATARAASLEMAKQMAEEKANAERLAKSREELWKKMAEEKAAAERTSAEMTRKMEEEKAAAEASSAEMAKWQERLAEEKAAAEAASAVMARRMAEEKANAERLAQSREEMAIKMAEERAVAERASAEMARKMAVEMRVAEAASVEMAKKMAEERTKAERLAKSREDMAKKMAEEKVAAERASLEMANQMATEKATAKAAAAEMAKKMAEQRANMDRLVKSREQLAKEMAEEKAAAERASAKILKDMARKLAEEKANAEKRLAKFREQTEAELNIERRVTSDIMQCLRDLPPLQTAMEFGDIQKLDEELQKWSVDSLPARFGDSKGVVEAVVKLAHERLFTWRGVFSTVQDAVKESEHTGRGNSVTVLYERCYRLFRSLKEAQLTKMDISRCDPSIIEKIRSTFYSWQEHAMSFPNSVQKTIIDKVVNCKDLGSFAFVDMDICLQLVDRSEESNEIFLSRARAIVDDGKTRLIDLKPLLSHIETMLFFLKYAKSEDLKLTHSEFYQQISSRTLPASLANQLKWALSAYPPGSELARLSADRSLMDGKDVSAVLAEIRKPPGNSKDDLGFFREIFYHWAVAMRSKFDLLVLPHHTQVVCLLAFRRFLEEAQHTSDGPHGLVAQVGTGEGKSMIIAILAVYVVVVLRKKVHIVVDDESLLERDFWTFKPLFDDFEVPTWGGFASRRIKAMICVREERLAAERNPFLAPRIDPEADICYCMGKHVQSFYSSIARDEKCDFDGYADRILIVDEVDALVIDAEPNEPFVYPNEELSKLATLVAGALKKGSRPEDAIKSASHPAALRVVREMCNEWVVGMNMVAGEDFVYVKDVGRNCLLRAGRANPNEWSLALECRNFQNGHSREIFFQERLFVMSRPRVFRKYHRLLGVSGSIGSDAERKFLQDTYKAVFFEVPPFLKTCKGSPFHAATPARLGAKKQVVYVETTPQAHMKRLAEIALEAREKVPVLIIAKDRSTAEQFVEYLQSAGRSRGLGNASKDAVRSLSRTLYDVDPEQWKENLNRATLPLGEGHLGGGSWRITVTDPSGGRGIDYRVDDTDVDGRGGLLLIPTIVPTSKRDWVQFLGRTARQDRKGQFCAVLCEADYAELSTKYRKTLTGGNDLAAVETILSWGNRECTERIQGSAALYNCGVRMNELCEEIFSKRARILDKADARECLVGICQSYRYMSVRDIDNAFAQIPGLVPSELPTEAKDLGPAADQLMLSNKSNRSMVLSRPGSKSGSVRFPASPASCKILIFCLDYSTSMRSRDTLGSLNRFDTCKKCVERILQDQVQKSDMVGIVVFGPDVKTVVPPTVKGSAEGVISAGIKRLAPSEKGGTCFFDAVLACLQSLGHTPSSTSIAPASWPRWVVCLTDGDDIGSRRTNDRGQEVTRMLDSGSINNLNMVVITVGKLKDDNMKVIDTWAEKVQRSGGFGRHIAEKDAAAIDMAFDVVAECLAADVGGAVEC